MHGVQLVVTGVYRGYAGYIASDLIDAMEIPDLLTPIECAQLTGWNCVQIAEATEYSVDTVRAWFSNPASARYRAPTKRAMKAMSLAVKQYAYSQTA